MYRISRLVEAGRLPRVPMYLDSPMAVEVTRLFDRHTECYDDEAREILDEGRRPLHAPGLKLLRTADESKALNNAKMPSVIMASSGMCTAGRIKAWRRARLARPGRPDRQREGLVGPRAPVPRAGVARRGGARHGVTRLRCSTGRRASRSDAATLLDGEARVTE